MPEKASDIWQSAHLPILHLLREWEKQQLPYKLKRHFVRIRRATVFFWTQMTIRNESKDNQTRILKSLARTNRTSVSELIVSELGLALGYFYLAETHRYSGTSKAYVGWLYRCALMRDPGLKTVVFDSLSKHYHVSGDDTQRLIALQSLYLFTPTEKVQNTIIELSFKFDQVQIENLKSARELLEHTIATILCGKSPVYVLEALHVCLRNKYRISDDVSFEERPSFAEYSHSSRLEHKLSHLLPAVLAVFAYQPALECMNGYTAKECVNSLVELFGDGPTERVSGSEKVTPGDLLFEELELASIPVFSDISQLRRLLYEQISCSWASVQLEDKTHGICYDDYQRVQCVIFLAKQKG
ncbi:hypothetical protein CJU90_4176 [Yarrowia sp. C11]|nr:hypothetical protein CKK34_6792 [Yarrowia sp. E02]KAG5365118.1 hypothetical protein CJU90_4176 [Yarrowia sp. C11]